MVSYLNRPACHWRCERSRSAFNRQRKLSSLAITANALWQPASAAKSAAPALHPSLPPSRPPRHNCSVMTTVRELTKPSQGKREMTADLLYKRDAMSRLSLLPSKASSDALIALDASVCKPVCVCSLGLHADLTSSLSRITQALASFSMSVSFAAAQQKLTRSSRSTQSSEHEDFIDIFLQLGLF